MIRKSLTIKVMFSYALIMTIFLLLSMQKNGGLGKESIIFGVLGRNGRCYFNYICTA